MTRLQRWSLALAGVLLAAGFAWGQGKAQNPKPVVAPDGKREAVASGDTIRVVDKATQKDIYRIKAHTGTVTALAYSPDGKWLISGGDDKTVRVHEGATGKTLWQRSGAKAAVATVVVSPDGKTLHVGYTDKSTADCDLATGKLLK